MRILFHCISIACRKVSECAIAFAHRMSRIFSFFFFSLPSRRLVWFYYMSAPFCCTQGMSPTKARSKKISIFVLAAACFCFFCLFSVFYWKLNVLILARGAANANEAFNSQWMRDGDALYYYYYFSDSQFHLHVLVLQKATEQCNNGDCRKREENRDYTKSTPCSPNWTVIQRFMRNSSFPFQRTVKWHIDYLFALLFIRRTDLLREEPFISPRGNYLILFRERNSFNVRNGELCRAVLFHAWIHWICGSNGDTKSMLICQFFVAAFCHRSLRRIPITSAQFVNCPFALTNGQMEWNTSAPRDYLHLHSLNRCAKICNFFSLPKRCRQQWIRCRWKITNSHWNKHKFELKNKH